MKTTDEPSGFIERAEAAEPAVIEPEDVDLRAREAEANGIDKERIISEAWIDALEAIVKAEPGKVNLPAAVQMLAQRLRDVEHHLPDAIKVGQAMGNVAGRVGELEKAVTYLSQQRAVAEIQMERHVRAVALDMAIKALTDAMRSEPAAITTYADAFLVWLKAGAQA